MSNFCLPHARGGVSRFLYQFMTLRPSSPCTWGCFRPMPNLERLREVFPMHVGVFPGNDVKFWAKCRLPHARGGVSRVDRDQKRSMPSSPCTWGCFSSPRNPQTLHQVFPMHVGVFPSRVQTSGVQTCLPHARGGVSCCHRRSRRKKWSSPCTWGCFQHGCEG